MNLHLYIFNKIKKKIQKILLSFLQIWNLVKEGKVRQLNISDSHSKEPSVWVTHSNTNRCFWSIYYGIHVLPSIYKYYVGNMYMGTWTGRETYAEGREIWGYFKTLAHFGQLSFWTKAPISIEVIVKITLKCQNQSIWSASL